MPTNNWWHEGRSWPVPGPVVKMPTNNRWHRGVDPGLSLVQWLRCPPTTGGTGVDPGLTLVLSLAQWLRCPPTTGGTGGRSWPDPGPVPGPVVKMPPNNWRHGRGRHGGRYWPAPGPVVKMPTNNGRQGVDPGLPLAQWLRCPPTTGGRGSILACPWPSG